MFKAHRITSSSGASYDDPLIIPSYEIRDHGFERIFGDATMMVCYKGVWHAINGHAISTLVLRKLHGPIAGMAYERIVMADDSLYGPGVLISETRFDEFDIPRVWVEDDMLQLAFTTPTNVILAVAGSVLSLEFPATVQSSKPLGTTAAVRSVRSR